MIYVALVEAVALVCVAALLSTHARSITRQAARERDLLINQLLHAAGRTWQPPPSEPPAEPEPLVLVRSPEQWPDGDLIA